MLRRMSRWLLAAALAACVALPASAQTGGAVSAGTVTSVADGKITLTQADGTMIFSAEDLAPDARILLGGQPKKLTDIKVGAKLNVLVGADFAIHTISDSPLSAPAAPKPAAKPPVPGPRPVPTQWNSPSVNGKVRWWTGVVSERGTQGSGADTTMMFVLARPGATGTQAFTPTSKTKFYVMADGKAVPASFAEIVLGKTVSAAMQDGQVIQATVLR